jgi:hypothetical protein
MNENAILNRLVDAISEVAAVFERDVEVCRRHLTSSIPGIRLAEVFTSRRALERSDRPHPN